MARGYDNYIVNQELLLDLQFSEGTGTNVQDWAKPHHVCALAGTPPSWAALGNDLPYLDFDSTAPRDYIISVAGVTGDLNFTTGDFSCAVWIRPDAGGNRYLFARGFVNTDGWVFFYDTDEALTFGTYQAAAEQYTTGATNDVTLSVWSLIGVTRSGATARVYVDGVETTVTYGTHVDPLTSARNLYIGSTDAVGAGWYDGDIWRPRIWGKQLSTVEMRAVFESERHLFGV
jgi:hypothetical protein